MYKFGYIGIIGRPNAGKSTLVNALVGEKVAIVSSKPQTTRDNILGIVNGENYQMVLVDTPGVHHSKNKLDKYMIKNVRSVISGVDVIVYLIDGSKQIDDEEREYIEKLRQGDTPTILVATKADKPQKLDFETDFCVSALCGKGLVELKEKLLLMLPESETVMFDKDYYTDKSVKYLIAEELRGQCLELFKDEIPHGIAIDITRFDEGSKLTAIEADIICEKERHKGIIIGKGGINLKIIGQKVRAYAEELLSGQVLLKLFVKVDENWRDKESSLRSLGYDTKKR